MKLAVVGGGGSRTPLLYHGLQQRARDLPALEIVLHDTDAGRLQRVEKVLRGIDEESNTRLTRTTTTDLDDALTGAVFVVTAIRAGGFEARLLDETIPLTHGIVGQETVGPGGFALAARNIPALVAIGRRMAKLCPDAWLINLSNPAGMATQALAPLLGGRVVGVCDSPLALGRGVAAALGVDVSELHLEYGGLNHLGWLTGAWLGGRDLLADLLSSPALTSVEEVRLVGRDAVADIGAIPNEYLYFYERTGAAVENIRQGGVPRGQFLNGQQRLLSERIDAAATPAEALDVYRRGLQVRSDTYMAIEAGIERTQTGDAFASAGGYHEVALSALEAIALDKPAVLIVNTTNRGALSFLADDDVVEVTSVVRRAGVFPLSARVPGARRELIKRVKDFERAALDALGRGSIAAVDALACNPLVPSRELAAAIVDEYVGAMPAVASGLGVS